LERDWEKLRKRIVRRRLENMPVTTICAQAKIRRNVFYFWWNRLQAEGWNGLQEKQCGRLKRPELDGTLKKRVVKLRERYGWGPNKIAGHLSHKGFTIGHNQAYHVICEAGLNHSITEPRKTWGTKRFHRERNNSLWQADFKLCSDDWWMMSYQDGHSRFIMGSTKIWSPAGENAILFLEKAVK
jgi:hypothetical protein